ncbi:MAG: transporter, family, tetracycline resistance protein [Chthoniobacter sp.]|jgi:multidrug resistance protein|nr:transporter, family, tetracycline resistance protein [Chthoniobacter sp.]
MSQSKSPLGLIFLTLFIDMVGFGIVIPVLPLYAEGTIHATPAQLSWIVGIYSLLQLVCSPLFGKWSDRIGRKPVLVVSIIGTAIGFMILGAAHTVWMLVLGRIIDGASGGNISTAMACIADVTTKENRSRNMGLVGAAFGLGFMIGPALGGILSKHFGLATPFYFAAGLALLNALLVWLRLPETLTAASRERAKERATIGEVFHGGRTGIIAAILASQLTSVIGFSIMTSLFALFCKERFGYDAAHVGYLLAYVGLLGVVFQGGLLRRLLKRPIEKQLAVIGAAVLALSMASLPFTRSLGVLMVVCFGISLGNSFVTPTLNGLASRTTDAHCQGRLLGLMQSAGSLGRFLGPMIGFGLVAHDPVQQYGRTSFFASAAILFLTMLFVLSVSVAPAPAPAGEAVPEI